MIGKYIYGVLTNVSAITTLTGTRIYPVAAPLETATPYITYRVALIDPRDAHKDGPAEKDNYTVVFNVFESTEKPNEALDNIETIFDAIRVALEWQAQTVNGVTVEHCQFLPSGEEEIDPETGLFFKQGRYVFSVFR